MAHPNLLSWLEGQALRLGASSNPINSVVRRGIKKRIRQEIMSNNPFGFPQQVLQDKYDMAVAILDSASSAFDRGIIGPAAGDRIMNVLLQQGFLKKDPRHEAFLRRHGIYPPGFMVISPTMRCNLACRDCYAGSHMAVADTLPCDVFSRILEEKHALWGSHFTVISGGEPFMYEDSGTTILDVFAAHPDQYFLVYTNGTLLDRAAAARLGELGNVTPAISVEGFEDLTDARRGTGTFGRIREAMENLRAAGVPFGISTTVSRRNVDTIISDAFVDFFFEEQGCVYQWIFQYMPIGRGRVLRDMLEPDQRMRLYDDTWRRIRKQKRFIADFWNCGSISDGCIAAGGGNGDGYLYITADGTISPCVFNPFTTDNVIELYERGFDLDTAYFSRFFEAVRTWQRGYFHERLPGEHGNLIAPCPIRDHHADMREIIDRCGARPLDGFAADALEDREYYDGMCAYNRAFDIASAGRWRSDYLEPEMQGSRALR
ncbi:MAG: radical SAM/SPASM domain-containing protein [Candidatus Krumholzibacteria bacterium]|nr:radical SAM/SPASM domain-containing protein [Candidatus Krumholzibacteria bacterium]